MKNDKSWRAIGSLFVLVSVILGISRCTTLESDPPDRSEIVYRLKIENISDMDITYSPEVSIYYIDRKINVELPDSTISPDEPAQIFFESKPGAYGISVDVSVKPRPAKMRMPLQKGTGTADNFKLEEVLETEESNYVVVIRYGDYY